MADSFVLTLDTTAPQITWGAVAGATAGELLQLGYGVDELGIVDAQLELSDGRVLPLTDTGLTLETLLPPDTPDGWATVRALLRDDVWNEQTVTQPVLLVGVIVAPIETPTTGGLPARARRRRPREPRTIRARSTVATSSSTRLLTSQQALLGIAVATSAAVMSSRSSMTSAGPVTRARVIAHRADRSRAARTLSREGSVTRRDGPNTEAALLLDLL